ncbi:MAG TPA: hypothetical protein VEU96_20945 [Bryobacteraceae bacterium]|nr:hypothetical protein [Bryobacteraceae bacterium]
MAAHDEPMAYPGANDPQDPASADVHLNRLLAEHIEEPFFRTFIKDLKEFIHPQKLPPLELTSKPVAVKDIWGF